MMEKHVYTLQKQHRKNENIIHLEMSGIYYQDKEFIETIARVETEICKNTVVPKYTLGARLDHLDIDLAFYHNHIVFEKDRILIYHGFVNRHFDSVWVLSIQDRSFEAIARSMWLTIYFISSVGFIENGCWTSQVPSDLLSGEKKLWDYDPSVSRHSLEI